MIFRLEDSVMEAVVCLYAVLQRGVVNPKVLGWLCANEGKELEKSISDRLRIQFLVPHLLCTVLSSRALLCAGLINSWGKRPSASSVFGKYLTQQGLWLNNGYLLPSQAFLSSLFAWHGSAGCVGGVHEAGV